MKSIRLLLITLIFFLLLGSSVLAATDSYTIERGLTASGGGIRESQGFSTRDIIGQTAAGISSSENYKLYAGYFTPYFPEEPKAVGGNVYTVNKVNILLPWMALALAIIFAGIVVVRRRVFGSNNPKGRVPRACPWVNVAMVI